MNRFTIELSTEGDNDIVDLTPLIHEHAASLAGIGLLHVFVDGSTASIATIEFEPGLVKHDLPKLLEQLAPADGHYYHEQTWNDDNGHSHIRSTLLGSGVTIPFERGRLLTGQWQQVVLIDFDTRPRRRRIICTVIH